LVREVQRCSICLSWTPAPASCVGGPGYILIKQRISQFPGSTLWSRHYKVSLAFEPGRCLARIHHLAPPEIRNPLAFCLREGYRGVIASRIARRPAKVSCVILDRADRGFCRGGRVDINVRARCRDRARDAQWGPDEESTRLWTPGWIADSRPFAAVNGAAAGAVVSLRPWRADFRVSANGRNFGYVLRRSVLVRLWGRRHVSAAALCRAATGEGELVSDRRLLIDARSRSYAGWVSIYSGTRQLLGPRWLRIRFVDASRCHPYGEEDLG